MCIGVYRCVLVCVNKLIINITVSKTNCIDCKQYVGLKKTFIISFSILSSKVMKCMQAT